ncbi:hypothetical protein EYR41_005247 [Orbilia oligospora]|uniref:Uncharacterized protein n=1 Tax=Orbilia oligospora TaxID=2813651 RepID=A0A8H2E4A8_ORBOL|nr:hypothetical protein TWF132_003366 [Orbilia oligospora]TGJ69189.1 hypothetical protein EYR41_005247 [Orbilia oligospora]
MKITNYPNELQRPFCQRTGWEYDTPHAVFRSTRTYALTRAGLYLAEYQTSGLQQLGNLRSAGSMQDTGVTLSESLSINLSFNLIPIDLPDDPLTLRHRLLANEVGLPLL